MRNPLRRFGGEPTHPAVVHFPLALFPAAVLFDLLALARADGSLYTRAAFILMLAASAAAVVAILTGFIQLLDVPSDSGAWRVAIWHMSVQLVAAMALLVSLLLRIGHVDDPHPPLPAVILAAAGSAVLLFGGWLGGRLVFSYGVSVAARQPEPPPAPESEPAAPTSPRVPSAGHR